MNRFEYKTTVLRYQYGFFKNRTPDIQSMLERESDQGWRLKEMLMATNNSGGADSVITVFERAL
jgi:hypothetical protein